MFKELPVLRGQDKLAYLWHTYKDAGHFCGGFVRWMVSPLPDAKVKPYGDIDFYPNDMEAFNRVNLTVSNDFNLGKENIYTSPVATSYNIPQLDLKLQLIKPQDVGSPIVTTGGVTEIIKAFDFTITMAGLKDFNTAIVHEDFISHEMQGKLSIRNIHCPLSIVKRIHKYLVKGYTISPLELYKLYIDWDARSKDYKIEMQDLMNKLEEADGKLFMMDDTDDIDRLKQLLYVD